MIKRLVRYSYNLMWTFITFILFDLLIFIIHGPLGFGERISIAALLTIAMSDLYLGRGK